MSKKKTKCRKCNERHFCDEHHILPEKLFGKNDETVELCKNCHDDYHRYLGHKYLKKENKQSMEF